MVMHVSLSDSLAQGMRMMKYSVNHPWKFYNWKLAFLPGFLQTVSIMLVETVNIIAILSQGDVLDIVMNFMALVVISDFGQLFYNAHSTNSEWKEIITCDVYTDMLKIQTTTSYNARHQIEGNKLVK